MSDSPFDSKTITVNGQPAKNHVCPKPLGYDQRVLDWECGICGRVFAPSQFGWIETRGPREPA